MVDEPVGHASLLGDVGDARGSEATFDHDLAGDLEDLSTALFDGGFLHFGAGYPSVSSVRPTTGWGSDES